MIFAISFWQWLTEFLVTLASVPFLFFFRSQYQIVENLVLIVFIFLMYAVLPLFYLLADQKFRNSYQQNGFFKSIWSAFRQDFE